MSALTRMDMAALRALWPDEELAEFRRSAWFIARHAKIGLRQAYDWLLDIGLAKVPDQDPYEKPWILRRCAAYATVCANNERAKGLRDGKLWALPSTSILSMEQHHESEGGEDLQPIQVSAEHADEVAWQAEARATQGAELVAQQQAVGVCTAWRSIKVMKDAAAAGQAQLPLEGGEASGRCPRARRVSIGRVHRDLKRRPDPTGDLFGDEGGEV